MRQQLLPLLLCVLCFCSLPVIAQTPVWSDADPSLMRPYTNARGTQLPDKFRLVRLDHTQAARLQQQAPMENAKARTGISNVRIPLPLPDGTFTNASLIESPILSPALQAQNSSLKTYELTDPATRNLKGRLTITPEGITGLVFTAAGSMYISPLGKDYPDVHMVYYVKDAKVTQPLLCGVKDQVASGNRGSEALAGDCQLRTYRLAVVATGEYTAWAGSQANAVTYITTLINDVTAIYERDATIRFTLVTNNSLLFTDSLADPYTTVGFPTSGTLSTNHATLNGVLTNAGYDLGIVLSDAWNGGLASLSSACNNSFKGQAAAGLTFGTGSNPVAGPQGPIFTGTVAHEIGHQFSATHSHAATNAGCGGANVSPPSAWEPGGGSTIMAYAGVCTANAYQNNSDLYFHGGNILQITSYATGTSCPITTALSNTAPFVSVTSGGYTIPASTPFRLDATATDANGNTLYHCWEQMDAGVTTSLPPSASSTGGPDFRSYPPVTDNYRVFPRLQDIITGAAHPYEVLPAVTRTMTFMDMVRDEAAGGGCTGQATVTVTTNSGAGPFIVTSQSTPATWAANGSNMATITWNVANTNAAPVNCTAVDILLSTDGGYTYPYTLASNTSNDGTENIMIPSLPTEIGRVMVRARNNIFFNINNAYITITSSCTASGASITPASNVSGSVNNAVLDLSLSPLYGTVVTPAGTLVASDPATTLSVHNVSVGNCITFSNSFQYKTYKFTPDVSGNYTFTETTGIFPVIFNIYSGDFNPSSTCSNLIRSNGIYTSSVGIGNTYTVALTKGLYYTLAVGTFSDENPPLPASYNISVTGAGSIYNATPAPGAGFNYTFVIVDNVTGNIKAFDAGTDLSNGTTYPIGTYTIYGLSYSSAIPAVTFNAYVGTSFTAFQNILLNNPGLLCGNVSSNTVNVTVTAALPVQLTPLRAYKVNTTADLRWSTASEQNSDYFEVLRSADGSNFDYLVGTVPAQGNSSTTTDYQLTDNNPLPTWNYYRLRQFDKDGRSVFSNIARLNMAQPIVNLSAYPNPVKTTLTLDYVSDKRETIQVRILDSKGSLVGSSRFNAQAGRTIHTVPVAALAKGIYVVQLLNSAETITTRFVKD